MITLNRVDNTALVSVVLMALTLAAAQNSLEPLAIALVVLSLMTFGLHFVFSWQERRLNRRAEKVQAASASSVE